jgi:hypothetical protein
MSTEKEQNVDERCNNSEDESATEDSLNQVIQKESNIMTDPLHVFTSPVRGFSLADWEDVEKCDDSSDIAKTESNASLSEIMEENQVNTNEGKFIEDLNISEDNEVVHRLLKSFILRHFSSNRMHTDNLFQIIFLSLKRMPLLIILSS